MDTSAPAINLPLKDTSVLAVDLADMFWTAWETLKQKMISHASTQIHFAEPAVEAVIKHALRNQRRKSA